MQEISLNLFVYRLIYSQELAPTSSLQPLCDGFKIETIYILVVFASATHILKLERYRED